jgi:hypothetical protein
MASLHSIREIIPATVCNICLTGNNWLPPQVLMRSRLDYQGPTIYSSIRKMTATTGRRTFGNAAGSVGTVWWDSCPFFSPYKAVLRQPLRRTKRTSCVASAITRSHICRLLLVRPSEEHLLRATM